jgi:lipopolysaccharide export system protein LptA
MVRPFNATVLAIFLSTALFATDIFAEKADRDKPLIINADTVKLDDVEQKYNLIGDILLTKGSMLATGDDGLIVVDPQGYENMNLKAAPRNFATLRTRREGLLNEYMQGIGKMFFMMVKRNRLFLLAMQK